MSDVKFNASIAVTELLTKTLENVAKDLASRCIIECATRHGFDATEEIRELGLENLSLIRKQMSKKSSGTKRVAKEAKSRKEKKSLIPMPFNASEVSECCCQGLTYNRGLFTQCIKKRMENSLYCSGCQIEADQNSSGVPNCGNIEARLACGLYEFKDPKGRSPVSYLKVLEKLKIGKESVEHLNIDAEHFELVEKVSKAHRGRPKKETTSIVAEQVSDLFSQLKPDAEEEEQIIDEVETSKKVTKKISNEDKEEKKKALEKERESRKAEREALRLLDKETKRLEKETKLAEEKAAKEAKIAQEKAAKDAKIAEEKAAKAAKEAKIAEEKAAKEALKSVKATNKKAKEVATEPVAIQPVAAEPVKLKVSRITIDGIEYLKSGANILYDAKTKEEVGLYDPVSKTINEIPEEDDEEEAESEYEEE